MSKKVDDDFKCLEDKFVVQQKADTARFEQFETKFSTALASRIDAQALKKILEQKADLIDLYNAVKTKVSSTDFQQAMEKKADLEQVQVGFDNFRMQIVKAIQSKAEKNEVEKIVIKKLEDAQVSTLVEQLEGKINREEFVRMLETKAEKIEVSDLQFPSRTPINTNR